MVALLVFAVAAIALIVSGVFAKPASGSDPGERVLPIPRLATESPFTLNVVEASGRDLVLKIEGIRDESVVQGDVTRLYGSTVPDALVTVNGEVVAVTTHGLFYTDLFLLPGTNFIEVVASDFGGRETSASFTVVSLQ